MNNSVRTTLAVVSGVFLWGVLWNIFTIGGMQLMPEELAIGQPVTHLGIQISFIIFSSFLSVAAGFTTARIAKDLATKSVRILAGVDFAIGLFFMVTGWELFPIWYHITVLALVIPLTLYGGKRGTRSD